MYSRRNQLSVLSPLKADKRDVSLIEDNIYISNRDFANDYHLIKSNSITLLIAVYPKDIKYSHFRPPDTRFYHIQVKDEIHEDLISHFDDCFQLIDEEITQNGGNVLVFCGAGLSRSVTIVCAFLMKKYKITAEEAVQRVKDKRKNIHPNIGFLAQLSIYEDMKYSLDINHTEYRIFILINLKKKIWSNKYWMDTNVAELKRKFCEPMQKYFSKLDPERCERFLLDRKRRNENRKSIVYYMCKSCSHVLFENSNILINIDCDRNESNDCPKLFIEPMKWMTPLICRTQSSPLECPNCATLLGSFKWKSYECDCNYHNQLQDSRIFSINKSAVNPYTQ